MRELGEVSGGEGCESSRVEEREGEAPVGLCGVALDGNGLHWRSQSPSYGDWTQQCPQQHSFAGGGRHNKPMTDVLTMRARIPHDNVRVMLRKESASKFARQAGVCVHRRHEQQQGQ